ncbi:hypothetical protein Asi02nite_36260 [Asanoa siamensis]|uniref:TrbL/VirB6 plasmid conjugal transfer protein n=1 Tax=Asanoa siamensis TaxID=926357 RepID=A0ABQ4CSX5_9ACTN|nr:hypothetical protein Asi02nite_36260 [Asanoa siamensis]
MAARSPRPRRPSRRAAPLLLLGIAVCAGLALLWVGPALADPSPAPGPAPTAPGAPTTEPGVPDPGSRPPALDPAPSTPATGTPAPIPQPTPRTPSPSGLDDDPAWYDVGGQIRKAVVDLVVWAADQALQPVIEALGESWLSTPDLTGNNQVTAIWTTSLVVANGIFILFIVAGGFLVSSRETLQTRYGLKQVLPRLAVGVVLANCSLILAQKAIEVTNALTVAIAGNTIDGPTAASAIRQIVDEAMRGHAFMLALLVIAVIVMCLVLEFTFVLRLAALIVLIGIAPAALICHASPLTESIAHTWWRAFAACLGMQLGQAIVVMATVKVFLTPTAPTVLGLPTGDGLLSILVCLTMLWILIKVPGWTRRFVLGPLGQRGGRGIIGQLVHTYLTIKTLGAATGLMRGAGAARAAGSARVAAGARATTPRSSGPRRSPPHTGGARLARSSPARSSPARPSPVGPAPFSHFPAVHTPLSSPSGTNGPPTFSSPPTPAGSSAPTGSSPPSASLPAARFSHPSAAEPTAASPAGLAARVAFSDAGSATSSSAPPGRAVAVTFSAAPTAHGAPRRPPAPVAPVFSSAPGGSSRAVTRSGAIPASRPTAARRASAAGRAAAGKRTPASPPPARTAPARASRAAPAARTTTAVPSPAPARRAPTPSRSGLPSPPTGMSGPSPAMPAAPAVRPAAPGSSRSPSRIPPSPAPTRASGSRTSGRRGER